MTENTPTGPNPYETGTGQGAWPPAAAGQLPSGGHAPETGPPAREQGRQAAASSGEAPDGGRAAQHAPQQPGVAGQAPGAGLGAGEYAARSGAAGFEDYGQESGPSAAGDAGGPGEYAWSHEYAAQYAPPGGYAMAGPYPPAGQAAGPPPNKPVRSRPWARGMAGLGIAALVGGAVGGGTVALVDHNRNSTVAVAPSVQRSESTAPSQPTSSDGTVAGAAAAIEKSVVTITVRASDGNGGTGSGVIVRSDGYILTNDHVVSAAGSGSITVTFADGRTATAKLVGRDSSSDLAVIKVDGVSGLTAATFADSSKLQVGQTVVAVGSPLGLDDTVTSGIVSALHRATRAGVDDNAVIDAVQTDAAINPGNSGGPLVDLNGQVIGINTSIATVSGGTPRFGQTTESGNIGIGFAIPSNTAADIADQLIAHGTATHAYLGVQVSSSGSGTTGGTSTGGGTLASVVSGGPAAKAGLRAGDVVTKVGDRTIDDGDDLVAAIRAYQPGDKVTLTIRRGGSTSTVTVTLGSDAQ